MAKGGIKLGPVDLSSDISPQERHLVDPEWYNVRSAFKLVSLWVMLTFELRCMPSVEASSGQEQ